MWIFYTVYTQVNCFPYKESITCISEASQMSLPINDYIPSLTNTASILLLHSNHSLYYYFSVFYFHYFAAMRNKQFHVC